MKLALVKIEFVILQLCKPFQRSPIFRILPFGARFMLRHVHTCTSQFTGPNIEQIISSKLNVYTRLFTGFLTGNGKYIIDTYLKN